MARHSWFFHFDVFLQNRFFPYISLNVNQSSQESVFCGGSEKLHSHLITWHT